MPKWYVAGFRAILVVVVSNEDVPPAYPFEKDWNGQGVWESPPVVNWCSSLMNPPHQQRRLWFANGFWWYSCPSRKLDYEISSLIRKHGFRSDRIASSLGLSERSFHRLINDSLGISPGIWLRQERAVASRYRLRGGASVKELAFEYGFKHPGDFTNEFKLWHGVAPRLYCAAASKSGHGLTCTDSEDRTGFGRNS